MLKEANAEPASPPPPQSLPLRRFAAPAAVVLLMAIAYALGFHRYLTLQSVAENRASLEYFTQHYWLLALLAFMAVYAVSVALSIPGASVLTVLGGLLFGWLVAGLAVLFSATLGAAVIFLVVRTALGDMLVKRAGPVLGRIRAGFARDAFNYLLFLRLVPVFPFWLVNIAAGLANVGLRSFVLATAAGIIPATFTFAYLGEGLDSAIEAHVAARAACIARNGESACPFELSLQSLLTTEMALAFAALAVLALIPVAARRWRGPA